MKTLITVEQAIEHIERCVYPVGSEAVPILHSIGRVLSQDVVAQISHPPFDRSPLDGYAVRAADILGASRETPVTLQVLDKLYAGENATVPVGSKQAVRLMTGSMIPEGADSVIRQEDTDEGEEAVQIYAPCSGNVCHRGEDFREGSLLLPEGTSIDAAAVAVAASSGLTDLVVFRKVRTAVLSLGDELIQPGNPLQPGKIYDSNRCYLTSRLEQMGTKVVSTGTVGDDLGKIVWSLRDVCKTADLVVTTGGVSVGQKDLVEKALGATGARIVFHGISMKPGMPTLFAVKDGIPILGLSGNPFSAVVAFELLAHPLLAKMTYNGALRQKAFAATAANGFKKRNPSRRFLRGIFQNGAVTIPAEQSNGQMKAMVGCNCLVDIPAGTNALKPGDRVNIIMI